LRSGAARTQNKLIRIGGGNAALLLYGGFTMKKNLYFSLLLFLLSIAIVAYSANYPEWPTQQGQPIQCNFGFKSIATPTITLDDATPINLVNNLPAGTLGFEIRAASGAFVIAHPDNIATGTDRVGRLVEEGSSYVWNGLAGTFTGAVVANSGSCELVIDGAWGY